MNSRRLHLMLVFVALLVAPAALASASGTWRRLPAAPITPDFGDSTTVWTGKELVAFGRDVVTAKDANGAPYIAKTVNVAAAYDPHANSWRRLTPPAGPSNAPGRYNAVWTGKEMLVWSAFDQEAYNPATDAWRVLPAAPTTGALVVWTGREMIGWGGGCCGDAFSAGSAYNPTTNRWRKLARSPLAGSQHPVGAWTGRELVILVSSTNPDGRPWPARLARAAAYDPATNRWRRIAPLPSPQTPTLALWDGREVIAIGGSASYAYRPARNRWKKLARARLGTAGTSAVWTGKRVLVRDGRTGRTLSYDPVANRWAHLAAAPLPRNALTTTVWTGRAIIVWGGAPTKTWGRYRAVGASLAF